jgi:probable F420-dependent oxidoreductase
MGVVVELKQVGIWADGLDSRPINEVRAAAAEIEELGFGALWFPEITGREALSQAGILLAATRRMVVATGVASIYARDPVTMAAGHRTLTEAFPERFLLGLGVSHPTLVEDVRGHRFGPPAQTMRAYLDAMESTVDSRSVLGSLGPRMLALAAERTHGAFPLGMPVEHTASTRAILGPDRFLAVGLAVVLDHDTGRAREFARSEVPSFLPNRSTLLRALGYDVEGSDNRLADALVAAGDVEDIDRRIRAHLDAGADHVALHVLARTDQLPMTAWRQLANTCRDKAGTHR